MKKTQVYIFLALIISFGFFLRIYNIENVPPGIYPDEAVNGLDALEATEGNWQWFYPANNGREGLFMNLIALCFKLFGVSILTLKLPAIIFGTLTILGTYLFAKELFRNERIGLISSFLVATSFWAINFSRISFRANMLPVILVFSFYFLARGLRTKKWTDFALGGFIFGLGLHTYISFRIAPAILIVALIALIINRRHFLQEYWKNILFFFFFFLISSAPMLYTFFISHPEYLESRSASISVFSLEANGGHPIKSFLKSFSLSLLKYNFWGDQNWRHNFPPYPLLDPITGIAFMFGLIYVIWKFFHLATLRFFKKIHDEKIKNYLILLASFFFMLAPEFLTAEGNPHALRAIGTLPFVFIFSALTFNYLLEYVEKLFPNFKKIIYFLFILIFAFIGIFNSVKYHLVWAKKPQTAEAFDKIIIDIEKYIQTISPEKEIFLLAGNMQRVPLKFFNWKNQNFHNLHPTEIDNISPNDHADFVIIFMDYYKDDIIKNINLRFPRMQLEEKKGNFGQVFYILK